jgi:uncharacterized protein CbrC (UPF0167 family)
MKFKYFRNPEDFASKVDEESECSICNSLGMWFNAGGYPGLTDIDCVCDQCLINGALEDIEVEANQAIGGSPEQRDTIVYRTPALPTWQECLWPYVDDDYCIFEKIASKTDFDGKSEFIESFFKSDKENSDLDWLWESLPDKAVTDLENGNYNVSVYLFTRNGKKWCLWDAN